MYLTMDCHLFDHLVDGFLIISGGHKKIFLNKKRCEKMHDLP